MVPENAIGLYLGAIGLGAVHGIEPGHGWPVAASYALERTNKWLYGFAASFILGVGHLISSIAMVGAFFYAKAYFELTEVDSPITVVGGLEIGGPVSVVAGVLLIGLGIREYTHGHGHSHGLGEGSHGDHGSGGHDHARSEDHHRSHADDHDGLDGHDHDHSHDHGNSHDHDHLHDHGHEHPHSDHHEHDGGGSAAPTSRVIGTLRRIVPFAGGHDHAHPHDGLDQAADRGLLGIAWFAFLLGFAHEEEFEIIALCAGSTHCLELMTVYALTVIAGIVGLTMLLIAGFEHYEDRVERITPYLPAFSATVLIVMGIGFVAGLL